MEYASSSGFQRLSFSARDTFSAVKGNVIVLFGPKASDWTFPSYITSEVIQEVIRNTCFVCGGLMKDSTAFKNQDIIEIPNGLSMTSHVYSNAGEAKQIKVRKCSSCGHSHT